MVSGKGYLFAIVVLMFVNVSKTIWRLFLRYPFSLAFFFLYALLCGRFIWIEWLYKKSLSLPLAERMCGECLMYGYFFVTIIAIAFILVTMVNIIARKNQQWFYIWLLVFIIVPLIIMWNIA